MSAVVSEMLIRIAADTAQLRSQMQQAERSVGGSLDSIKNVASQARTALIGFFAIDKAMDLATTFVKTADAMALTAARLKLVTSSQQEFEAVQKDVYRISQQNNVGLEEMSTLYAKLHEPVKRLGGTTAETTKIVESFALSLRVGGANTQEAASATLQFAQAMASGKLSGDEFRSIAEASPRFMKALADGMGVPIEQLKKLGSEGKLTADVVGNALMKSLSVLQQEAQSIPDTVGGAFTRVKNEIGVFTAALNESTGATSGLAQIVGGLADWVKQITSAFKTWGEATKGATGQVDLAAIGIKVLGTIFETIIVLAAEVAFVVRGIAKSFADVSKMAQAFANDGLDGLAKAYRETTEENEAIAKAHKQFTASVAGATDKVLQQRDALKNNSLSAAENSNEMDRLVGKHGQVQTATLKSTAVNEEAVKAEQKRVAEVKKLMNGLEDQVGAMLAAEQAEGKLSAAQKTALKVMQDLQQGRINLTDAEKRALVVALEGLLATEKRIEADKELADTKRKVEQHSAKLTEAEWKEVEALREGNVKLMEQNERMRDGEAAVRQREIAVLRSTATDLEWTAANQGGNAALEEQARLLRQRAELLEEGNVLQAAKDTADEWKRTAQNIESALTDSLMRAFESGKDFGKALRDTLFNMFKTLVLRPIIQPIAQGLSGSVLGMLGMPAQAAGAAGGASNLTGIAGMTSMLGQYGATGFMHAVTGGGFATGMGAAGSIAGAGNVAGGIGMAAGTLAGYGAGAMVGIYGGRLISGGYSAFGGSGNTAVNLGTIAGMVIGGPIGAAIGGAIGGVVNRAFGRKLEDQGVEGTFRAGGFEGQSYQFYRGGFFRSDKTKYSDLDSEMSAALGAGSQAMYQQVKAYADILKLPSEALANVTSEMKVSLGDDVEKNQQAIAEAVGAYGDALAEAFSAQLAPFQREGEKLIETLQRLTILQAFSDNINQLGGIFSKIASSSIEAKESLIEMAGGIDALMGKAQTFIEEYYSQEEKAGMLARDVVNALKSLGIDTTNLATREDFRALVESRNVDTEEGRKQLLTLLDLAPAFAGLADYMGEFKVSLESLAQSAPQIAVLEQMIDPSAATANNTANMANSLEQSNSTLTSINGQLEGISASSDAAAAAAAAAAEAAAAAAAAAQAAAAAANAAASRPTYVYDIGGS